MLLKKFDFDVQLKERLPNTQADARFCHQSLEETTVPVDADIPTYPVHSDVIPTRCDGKEDLNASLALTTNTSPSFVLTTFDEIRLLQDTGDFCLTIRALLDEKKSILFVLSGKCILIPWTEGFEQVVISVFFFTLTCT